MTHHTSWLGSHSSRCCHYRARLQSRPVQISSRQWTPLAWRQYASCLILPVGVFGTLVEGMQSPTGSAKACRAASGCLAFACWTALHCLCTARHAVHVSYLGPKLTSLQPARPKVCSLPSQKIAHPFLENQLSCKAFVLPS